MWKKCNSAGEATHDIIAHALWMLDT